MIKSILLATCDRQLEIDIVKYFEKENLRIETVRHGQKLILEILDNDYDFLIIDQYLEGLSGEELIQIVRRSRPHVPIIYIAEKEDFEKSKRIMEEGILLRFFKPINSCQYRFLKDLIILNGNNLN